MNEEKKKQECNKNAGSTSQNKTSVEWKKRKSKLNPKHSFGMYSEFGKRRMQVINFRLFSSSTRLPASRNFRHWFIRIGSTSEPILFHHSNRYQSIRLVHCWNVIIINKCFASRFEPKVLNVIFLIFCISNIDAEYIMYLMMPAAHSDNSDC